MLSVWLLQYPLCASIYSHEKLQEGICVTENACVSSSTKVCVLTSQREPTMLRPTKIPQSFSILSWKKKGLHKAVLCSTETSENVFITNESIPTEHLTLDRAGPTPAHGTHSCCQPVDLSSLNLQHEAAFWWGSFASPLPLCSGISPGRRPYVTHSHS